MGLENSGGQKQGRRVSELCVGSKFSARLARFLIICPFRSTGEANTFPPQYFWGTDGVLGREARPKPEQPVCSTTFGAAKRQDLD